MAKLPITGIEIIAEGVNKYLSDVDKASKATDDLSKSTDKAGKQSSVFARAFSTIGGSLGGFAGQINSLVGDVGGLTGELGSLTAGLSPATLGIAAAGVAAAAAATAFVALGLRGAELTGLADSFARLTSSIGIDADKLVADLNTASRGAVSNFDLIRRANFALSGATGEFGTLFGESLPRLLRIAGAQANATGQDINFLFESLVTGVKRGSPLLIDNTGLTISVGEANAVLAQQLGKTVEQLTAEEKQIALLNATLAAGNIAIAAFGDQQETAADKLARANAGISNIFDTLALAVQPAFEIILDVGNQFIAVFQNLATDLSPLLSVLTEIGAVIFDVFFGTFLPAVSVIFDVIGVVGQLISVALTPLLEILRFLGGIAQDVFGNIISGIGNALSSIVNTFFPGIQQAFADFTNADGGLDFDKLRLSFARGAGAVMGALAAGFEAGKAQVLRVIAGIAQSIADFLIGESPPPVGPLSQIDKGGANTMAAYLQGIAGVSLQPVKEVAANVNAALGQIGKFNTAQVDAALAKLDAQLQPFNDQLKIVKANFEAISAPAKAALDAIDRQLEKAISGLSSGTAESGELVRQLDAQRAAIEASLEAQQSQVDAANIQLALAQSQQAEERALLEIRKGQLALTKEQSTEIDKVGKAASAAGGGAGAGALAAGGGAAGSGFGIGAPVTPGKGAATVDTQGAFQSGFSSSFASSGGNVAIKESGKSSKGITSALTAIGNVDLGARIASTLDGASTAVSEKLNELGAVFTDFIGSVTDPSREGSIPFAFGQLGARIASTLDGASAAVSEKLNELGAVLSDFGDSITNPSREGSIPFFFSQLPARIQESLDLISTTLNFSGLLESIALLGANLLDPALPTSLTYPFAQLPIQIATLLADLPTTLIDTFVIPLDDAITYITGAFGAFFGEGGGLSQFLDTAVAFFVGLPQRIQDALSGIGGVFFTVFVSPIIGGLNAVITGIEQTVNGALLAVSDFLNGLQEAADAAGLGEALGGLRGTLAQGIVLPRIPLPAVPGAATGGTFGAGLLQVGERGRELIAPSEQITVFPNEFIVAVETLARVLSQPQAMSVPLAGAGAYYNTTNNDNSINFNGSATPDADALQRLALQRMRGG